MNNLHLTDIDFEANSVADLYVAPGPANFMHFLTVKGCNFSGGSGGSVYLDRVTNGVFFGGRAANAVQTTTTCSNIYFLDLSLPGSGNTFNGSSIVIRNGSSLQYWNNNVLINEIAGGGQALQINGQQGFISVQTLTAPGPQQQLSERMRWTTGADTSKVQVYNATFESNAMTELTPGYGIRMDSKIRLLKLDRVPSTTDLLDGYMVFGKVGSNLSLYFNDSGTIKSVVLT